LTQKGELFTFKKLLNNHTLAFKKTMLLKSVK
jgi:hypothetical protein